jgi:phenylalanyl-tRNA synthetase beta chain
LEGLARALKVFLAADIATMALPKYRVIVPEGDALTTLTVHPETAQVRPVVVAAILRNISFTQASYESFIDLQDKLHNGIGRRRQIVSMGTHDLDTVKGPFSYEAVAPEKISFVPLNQEALVDGMGMMSLYENDNKLKKFLPIIRDSPIYPVIYDSEHTVMSVPPIINSDHSKISLATKNVFIEITATDETKALVALNTITIEFSKYCADPCTVEAVKIVYPSGRTVITPDFSDREEIVDVEYINRCIGIKLTADDMVGYLKKMFVEARNLNGAGEQLLVQVPPHRSDIFHACDIMEDVAISYGFNRIPQSIPKSSTIAAAFPLNKLTDLLRREVALVGFSEVLTLTLCSHKENFEYLKRVDPGNEAVVLSNPKTIEYEVVHTSLVPEMLKTIASNKKMPLPIKVFQIADVVFQDSTSDVGARNERRLSAVICDLTSGFEVIHGLLDRVMQMVGIPMASSPDSSYGYSIKPSSIPMYFPGRQAEVFLQGKVIGSFGIVHPEVLDKFEVPNVASLLEINIEPFL